MFNKLKNRKAFTLMEMLIVVAIIAILVAIAIPTFNNAMAKSRAATDLANIRSGYAAALMNAMTENITDDTVYYLQADGSVSTTSGTGDYVTKGTSKKAADGSTVGGKFTVDPSATAAADGTVYWEKDNTISYTVTRGTDKTEYVPSVIGIAAAAKAGN